MKAKKKVKKRILYAEDYAALRQGVVVMLKRKGYKVEPFENGADLMLRLKDDAACDIVVTDNDMPILTGMGVLMAIKSDPALKHLPVIVFSGDDMIRPRVAELGGISVDKGNIGPLLDAIAKITPRAA